MPLVFTTNMASNITHIFAKFQEKAVTQTLQEITTYNVSTWLKNTLWPTTS